MTQISHIQSIGQDVLLSSANEPDQNLKIRFQNFLKDPSYRHIHILDSTQQFFQLNVNEQGQAYLGSPPGSLCATENADTLVITDGDILAENKLNALEGRDVIIDKSHYDYSLHGGEGDDIIIALETGHKKLYGDEGQDQLFSGPGNDDLTGGKGNDWLAGGKGDDRYFVNRLDEHTRIEDSGGRDTLVLADIRADELCFTQIDQDIYITLTDPLFRDTFSIKLTEWSSSAEKKIERIQVEKENKYGQYINDYDLESLLPTAISSFSDAEKQQLINHHNESVFLKQTLQRTENIIQMN